MLQDVKIRQLLLGVVFKIFVLAITLILNLLYQQ